MIRILFRFSLLFAVCVSHAQEPPHSLAIGVSNNGQLAGVSEPFYFRDDNMKAILQPGKTLSEEHAAFKATLEYSYRTPQNLELGLTCGFGLRRNSYVTDVSTITASQQYFSWLPFVLKTWRIGGLQLAAGGGIPVYVAGTFRASTREHADWMPADVVANNTLGGGTAVGINAIGKVRWFFAPRFSLVSTVQFGVVYSDFGGEFNVVPTADSYPVYFPPRTRAQRGLSLPAPELTVGLGFRI